MDRTFATAGYNCYRVPTRNIDLAFVILFYLCVLVVIFVL